MRPQIVRFISSNSDFPGRNLSQNANIIQTILPVAHQQKSFPFQLVNGTTPSSTSFALHRVFITSTTPTFNLYNEVTAQKSSNSSINNRIHGATLSSSSSVVGIPINKPVSGECISPANICKWENLKYPFVIFLQEEFQSSSNQKGSLQSENKF